VCGAGGRRERGCSIVLMCEYVHAWVRVHVCVHVCVS